MSESGTTGPLPTAELGPDHLLPAQATESQRPFDWKADSPELHDDISETAAEVDLSDVDDAGGVDPLTPEQEAELEKLDDELDEGTEQSTQDTASGPAKKTTTSDKKGLFSRAAYKAGYATGYVGAKATKAVKGSGAVGRPIDPILAEQYDAAQAGNLSEDISNLSDKELNDRLLEEGIENNPDEFHALGQESAKRQAEKDEAAVQAIFAELDADIANNEAASTEPSPFAAPKAEDRIIGSYLNAEGKPLGGFKELNDELARKVAEGDDTNWENLVTTLSDAVKYDAGKRGVSVEDRLNTFEAYAARKFEELKANKSEVPGGRRWKKGARRPGGPVVVPPIVEQTPHEEQQERKGKRRWVAAALLAGVALGAIGLSKSSGSESVTKDTPIEAPSNDGSTNSNINENGGVGDKPYGPEYNVEVEKNEDGTVKVPEDLDISDWTWNVAHNLSKGNEISLIQGGIDAYNKANGTDFALKPVNGTRMIVNGQGRVVNQTEMEFINQLMINEAP